MAQNPTGTDVDEVRLVALRTRDDGFRVDVTESVETADVPTNGPFAWHLGEAADAPRLAFTPVDDPGETGNAPVSKLATTDGRIEIAVPESVVVDGLGLGLGSYDDDNPLLFEPREITDGLAVGMVLGDASGEAGSTVETGIELRPVHYADGTPYSDNADEDSFDSDPIAEAEIKRERGEDAAPQSETLSAPVDAEIVDRVIESTDASRASVVEALETIARNDLVTVADDDADGEPLTADERALVALDGESWTDDVAAELDADETTVAAVREIHVRQADHLLAQTDAEGGRFDGRAPVVIDPT